ncbi:MAG: hypothetical protein LIO95_00095 [Clostridiales bacterium]|nr:hypothetical protein [Clostridiales bacterium]
MGHTRMATQGDEHCNYNNHPFKGRAGSTSFALAHNSVIHNDQLLKVQYQLPRLKSKRTAMWPFSCLRNLER